MLHDEIERKKKCKKGALTKETTVLSILSFNINYFYLMKVNHIVVTN